MLTCLVILLVSSKEEVDAPEPFVLDPVDLNSFFGDDGKIYGYQGLKVIVFIIILLWYADYKMYFFFQLMYV